MDLSHRQCARADGVPESLELPVVRGPGIARGVRAPGNIYLLDVLPTLCDLAGIQVPATVEGRSFRPVLEGRRGTIRDVVYGAFCGGTKPGMRAVKQGDWKLVKFDVLGRPVRGLEDNEGRGAIRHEGGARYRGESAGGRRDPARRSVLCRWTP